MEFSEVPQLYSRQISEKEKSEDELASTISVIESDIDETLNIIPRQDLLQLEVIDQQHIRTTTGKVKTGKIVKINETIVNNEDGDIGSLINLLCSTAIETIEIDSDIDKNAMNSFLNGRYSIQFRTVSDGPLGASVEFVPIPIIGVRGLGLQIQAISREAKQDMIIEIGDIILSVNGISVLLMDKQAAIQILTSSTKRKLVILRGVTSMAEDYSTFSVPAEKVPLKKRLEDINLRGLRRKVSLSASLDDQADERLFLSEEGSQLEKLVHSNEVSNSANRPVENNWKSIRSNYLCKTVYRAKRPAYYNQENALSLPKFRYIAELKTAVAFGYQPYKDLVMRSVESKINIASG